MCHSVTPVQREVERASASIMDLSVRPVSILVAFKVPRIISYIGCFEITGGLPGHLIKRVIATCWAIDSKGEKG